MGLDTDYLFADDALQRIHKILLDRDHGDRKEIADDILDFADKLENKYKPQNK